MYDFHVVSDEEGVGKGSSESQFESLPHSYLCISDKNCPEGSRVDECPVGYTGPVSELRENVTVLKNLIVGSSLTCTVRNSHWCLVQSAKTPVSRSVRFVQSAKPVGTDQVQIVWNVMWDLSHFAMPSWAL